MPRFRLLALHRLVVGTFCLAVVASARAADSVLLKPRPSGSTNSYVEFATDTVQKMAGLDGKPMEIKSRSLFGLLHQAAPQEGAMVIEVTLDRLVGSMSFTEAIKSHYDSDDPEYEEASPMHRDAFGPILNMTLTLKMDEEGSATAVEGGEPVRTKLKALGEQNFVAKSLAETELTDRQIMSTFGEWPVVLCANREVKVGQGWNRTQKDEYPQVGRVIVNYECKLDRIEKVDGRETAVVTYKGTIIKDPDEKPAKDQRLGKIDGSFSGIARFDVEKGRFIEIQRDTTAKLEVPPWWSKDPKAPLHKIDSQSKSVFTSTTVEDRRKRKAEIAHRVADAKAKREAEEAAALAGPVDPVTAENAPVAWLQWGGSNRDFCSDATGLANRWPREGPPKLWERPLGDGFSAILCDGDTLYTMYSIRDKDDALKGDEIVVALDAKSGKTRWEHKYPAPWPKSLQMEFGPGPHSTPVVVGDRLYTIGCTAKLFCLDKGTGRPHWSKDLHDEFKASLLMRGYGSSPLSYNGSILLPVSKEKGHAIMAFKQSDGSVAWKGGEFDPGYASLLAIDVGGVEQFVAFTGKSVMGVDPKDGRAVWSVDHPTQWSANISTPIWCEQDGHVFISSAYGMGSRGVKLEKAGSQVVAKEAWFNPRMKIQHGNAVRVGEWVYGGSGDFGPGFLACVSARTGEFGWRQRGIAKANVLFADGKLIVLDEDGTLFLVKADPAQYRLLGKAAGLCKKTAWTVPTLVGRTLYIRDREKIMALDLGSTKGNT
jgi:outer membrane protein assembly factor BamB